MVFRSFIFFVVKINGSADFAAGRQHTVRISFYLQYNMLHNESNCKLLFGKKCSDLSVSASFLLPTEIHRRDGLSCLSGRGRSGMRYCLVAPQNVSGRMMFIGTIFVQIPGQKPGKGDPVPIETVHEDLTEFDHRVASGESEVKFAAPFQDGSRRIVNDVGPAALIS